MLKSNAEGYLLSAIYVVVRSPVAPSEEKCPTPFTLTNGERYRKPSFVKFLSGCCFEHSDFRTSN
jgi:hypothetical protein